MRTNGDHGIATSGVGVRNRGNAALGVLSENLRKKKIPKLDALRAVSAFIVVIYHFGFQFFPAGLGVLVFFVISGFLITWLLLEETEKTGTVSLLHFYFRRTFRIFPAFYVFWMVLVGALLLKHGHIIWGQAIATFFYVGNYYQGLNHYPETGFSHAWSLGVEEQYYLLWPALVLLLGRAPRVLLRATCSGILLVWIYRLFLVYTGTRQEYIYTAFETRFDHLLIGCVVAISLRYGYFSRLWRFVCSRTVFMLVPLACLILSTIAFHAWGVDYRDVIGFIVDPLLVALLIVQLLASRARWLAWMDSRLLVYLGTISYSTYLYHEIASTLVVKVVHGRPQLLVTAFEVAAAYVIASISYFAVEKPFLRLRAKIESRHRVKRAMPSVT
jgi:peptidoglycan/LPS O-acetylase OafA/YrhL